MSDGLAKCSTRQECTLTISVGRAAVADQRVMPVRAPMQLVVDHCASAVEKVLFTTVHEQ